MHYRPEGAIHESFNPFFPCLPFRNVSSLRPAARRAPRTPTPNSTVTAPPPRRSTSNPATTVSGRPNCPTGFSSGGRVVAGSNPVTPTDGKSLIFNRISRIFLLWYIVRKVAVVHKWYINGRYPKISISVVKYLVVGWLLYLGLYSRSEQADNEFYRVPDYIGRNRAAVSSVGI